MDDWKAIKAEAAGTIRALELYLEHAVQLDGRRGYADDPYGVLLQILQDASGAFSASGSLLAIARLAVLRTLA